MPSTRHPRLLKSGLLTSDYIVFLSPSLLLTCHLLLLLTSVCLAPEVSLPLLFLLFSICWRLGSQTTAHWNCVPVRTWPARAGAPGALGTGFGPTFWQLTARLSGLRLPDGRFWVGGTSLHFLSAQGWVLAWGRTGAIISCGHVTWPRCSWHHNAVFESRECPP